MDTPPPPETTILFGLLGSADSFGNLSSAGLIAVVPGLLVDYITKRLNMNPHIFRLFLTLLGFDGSRPGVSFAEWLVVELALRASSGELSSSIH